MTERAPDWGTLLSHCNKDDGRKSEWACVFIIYCCVTANYPKMELPETMCLLFLWSGIQASYLGPLAQSGSEVAIQVWARAVASPPSTREGPASKLTHDVVGRIPSLLSCWSGNRSSWLAAGQHTTPQFPAVLASPQGSSKHGRGTRRESKRGPAR